MPFLILAMVLAIMQTSPPIPRQAADKPTRSGNNVKQNSSNKQRPPDARMRIPIPTESNQAEGQEQRSRNAQDTIIIRELAAVPHKDAWDIASVIFAGLLVIVGGFGVCLARRSLRAIESQLTEMQRQLAEMQEAGRKTERIIQRMKETA